MVASQQEERDAAMLIDSIHDFAGRYKDCTIYVAQTDPDRLSCEDLRGQNVELVPLKMNEEFRSYLFADKVYACAQVETMVTGKVQVLVWMNPQCLVLRPPTELELKPPQAAAVRPVHIRNVGSLANEPVNRYWSTVFKACELDPAKAFTVESFVDKQKVRAYFNSGTMSVRLDKCIFRTWRMNFEKLVSDKAFQRTIEDDRLHRLFLHQAVFSAVLVAKLQPSEIEILPPEYGYPLHLHDKLPPERKAQSLNDLTTVICEDYFHGPNWAQGIIVREPLKTWLASRFAGRR